MLKKILIQVPLPTHNHWTACKTVSKQAFSQELKTIMTPCMQIQISFPHVSYQAVLELISLTFLVHSWTEIFQPRDKSKLRISGFGANLNEGIAKCFDTYYNIKIVRQHDCFYYTM